MTVPVVEACGRLMARLTSPQTMEFLRRALASEQADGALGGVTPAPGTVEANLAEDLLADGWLERAVIDGGALRYRIRLELIPVAQSWLDLVQSRSGRTRPATPLHLISHLVRSQSAVERGARALILELANERQPLARLREDLVRWDAFALLAAAGAVTVAGVAGSEWVSVSPALIELVRYRGRGQLTSLERAEALTPLHDAIVRAVQQHGGITLAELRTQVRVADVKSLAAAARLLASVDIVRPSRPRSATTTGGPEIFAATSVSALIAAAATELATYRTVGTGIRAAIWLADAAFCGFLLDVHAREPSVEVVIDAARRWAAVDGRAPEALMWRANDLGLARSGDLPTLPPALASFLESLQIAFPGGDILAAAPALVATVDLESGHALSAAAMDRLRSLQPIVVSAVAAGVVDALAAGPVAEAALAAYLRPPGPAVGDALGLLDDVGWLVRDGGAGTVTLAGHVPTAVAAFTGLVSAIRSQLPPPSVDRVTDALREVATRLSDSGGVSASSDLTLNPWIARTILRLLPSGSAALGTGVRTELARATAYCLLVAEILSWVPAEDRSVSHRALPALSDLLVAVGEQRCRELAETLPAILATALDGLVSLSSASPSWRPSPDVVAWLLVPTGGHEGAERMSLAARFMGLEAAALTDRVRIVVGVLDEVGLVVEGALSDGGGVLICPDGIAELADSLGELEAAVPARDRELVTLVGTERLEVAALALRLPGVDLAATVRRLSDLGVLTVSGGVVAVSGRLGRLLAAAASSWREQTHVHLASALAHTLADASQALEVDPSDSLAGVVAAAFDIDVLGADALVALTRLIQWAETAGTPSFTPAATETRLRDVMPAPLPAAVVEVLPRPAPLPPAPDPTSAPRGSQEGWFGRLNPAVGDLIIRLRAEPATIPALVSATSVPAMAVAVAIGRLEAAGWVSRSEGPGSGPLIHLTAPAWPYAQALAGVVVARQRRLAGVVPRLVRYAVRLDAVGGAGDGPDQGSVFAALPDSLAGLHARWPGHGAEVDAVIAALLGWGVIAVRPADGSDIDTVTFDHVPAFATVRKQIQRLLNHAATRPDPAAFAGWADDVLNALLNGRDVRGTLVDPARVEEQLAVFSTAGLILLNDETPPSLLMALARQLERARTAMTAARLQSTSYRVLLALGVPGVASRVGAAADAGVESAPDLDALMASMAAEPGVLSPAAYSALIRDLGAGSVEFGLLAACLRGVPKTAAEVPPAPVPPRPIPIPVRVAASTLSPRGAVLRALATAFDSKAALAVLDVLRSQTSPVEIPQMVDSLALRLLGRLIPLRDVGIVALARDELSVGRGDRWSVAAQVWSLAEAIAAERREQTGQMRATISMVLLQLSNDTADLIIDVLLAHPRGLDKAALSQGVTERGGKDPTLAIYNLTRTRSLIEDGDRLRLASWVIAIAGMADPPAPTVENGIG